MNNSPYSDDCLLMLSGIQHFAFCERQWALIHIEQQWQENVLTVEGNHLHERVDDPLESDTRRDLITLRALTLVSYSLGFCGVADVVEFYRTDQSNGTELPNRSGKWFPFPIEYKRGKPKPDERDEVQLCAQAICLEEMYKVIIEKGALYYGKTCHRHEVIFDTDLREKVILYAQRMHYLFEIGITPLPVYKSHCKSCSLINICMPKTFDRTHKISDYLKQILEND